MRNLLARMRRGGDGEHQIVLNRLAIAVIILVYVVGLFLCGGFEDRDQFVWSVVCAVLYLAGGVAIAAALVARPRPSPARRIVQMIWDIGFLSFGMYLDGVAVIPFYPLYLWAILGYGFRFGLPYITAAAFLAAGGFMLAVHALPVWRDAGHLLAGLTLGLLVVPLYSASLIRFLSNLRRRAEEANRAKTMFLASVSHELRTPLNAVIGMTRLLNDTALDAEQREMLQTVRVAGTSLLGMVEGLLDFARIENGRMPVQAQPVDLMALLNAVRRIAGVSAGEKGLILACHVTARTPLWLIGDEKHLRDVLLNLVGNAVKFTAQGHVSIRVDALPAGSGGPARLAIEVVDTGIGIAQAALERIFDPFTQADATVIDRFGGSGLGLAICRQMVMLMGGEIGVRSREGHGSTFRVTLPLRIGTAPGGETGTGLPPVLLWVRQPDRYQALAARLTALGARLATVSPDEGVSDVLERLEHPHIVLTDMPDEMLPLPADQPVVLLQPSGVEGSLAEMVRRDSVSMLPADADDGWIGTALAVAAAFLPVPQGDPSDSDAGGPDMSAGRSLSILVVEDNIVNRKILCRLLSRIGHRWQAVANGEEALDILQEMPFDLVLMDLNMPVMNGIEATKLHRFSEVGGGRGIPIVALTADGTPETQKRCREAGMDAFLLKPVALEALVQAIEALVPAEAGIRHACDRPSGGDDRPGRGEATVVVPFPVPTINRRLVQDLLDLGGERFRAEVIGDFLLDAVEIVTRMDHAVKNGDRSRLLDEAHALRSAAANVGAERLAALCHEWRGIPHMNGQERARAHQEAIWLEMNAVEVALRPYTVVPFADRSS
ncbi:response regulator [Gluconacetobacter aggeris]|uniref:histidine kinase n=1 Tax=Gluconacetobacter aggeris TaxID=1286186 RepID=A0A7W4IRX9_9PROT|nr:response regulator [Gluconacetobacter aggeris]